MDYRPAVLIPVYNHEKAIVITLERALQHGYPILLVDDGSDANCHVVLVGLRDANQDHVSLITLPRNGGKGNAVKAGLRALAAEGYSHAIQLDADGQHDVSELTAFVDVSKSSPDALVTGYPEYDSSVPKARYYGRYLTHVWIWINTLSMDIRDSMCGFRVYPLSSVVRMLEEESCGDRMDFDPEVIVRWHWRGGKVINLPTHVSYPLDGVSHFNVRLDNFLISIMHTRLFFGMLWRLPVLLKRKFDD